MFKRLYSLVLILFLAVTPAHAQTIIKDGNEAKRYINSIGAGSQADPYLIIDAEFRQECSAGNITGCEVIHVFGRNPAVGTSYVPITFNGLFRTPQSGSATALRVKAGGNANDTAAGSGAREVTVECIDETGAKVTEAIATAGASASSATSITCIRLLKAYVSKSGTYATQSAGSHAGDIVIENSAGTEDWITIDATDFARGISEIGVYSVPEGKTGFLYSFQITVETAKVADILLFKREGILETAAPYSPMLLMKRMGGIDGHQTFNNELPQDGITGPADVGFMGKIASGTVDVDVDFEILLVDN